MSSINKTLLRHDSLSVADDYNYNFCLAALVVPPFPLLLSVLQYAAFEDNDKVYLLQEYAEGVSVVCKGEGRGFQWSVLFEEHEGEEGYLATHTHLDVSSSHIDCCVVVGNPTHQTCPASY